VQIIVVALSILREAYFGFLSPKSLEAPWTGLAVNALAGFINAGWGLAFDQSGAPAQITSCVDRKPHPAMLPGEIPCSCARIP